MKVILIHGQGRTILSMLLLGRRLKQRGCDVAYFGYAAFLQPFDSIVRRFVQTIRANVAGEPYIIVGHSLGNIIARAALPSLAANPPRHLVMLAPPNRPPWVAKKLRPNNPIYRLLTGDCGQKLADDAFYQKLPCPTMPATVIAGTHGWPKPWSPFGNEANDMVLTVRETSLEEADETILIPATHPFIMNSKQVAKIVLDILDDIDQRIT